jgi:hypothetical protein
MRAATFSHYLDVNRRQAGAKLLRKAYTANRLAKMCSGEARRRLYGLKYKYLSSAIEMSPESFYIDSAAKSGTTQILGIRSVEGFAFHIPLEGLSKEAFSSITHGFHQRRIF